MPKKSWFCIEKKMFPKKVLNNHTSKESCKYIKEDKINQGRGISVCVYNIVFHAVAHRHRSAAYSIVPPNTLPLILHKIYNHNSRKYSLLYSVYKNEFTIFNLIWSPTNRSLRRIDFSKTVFEAMNMKYAEQSSLIYVMHFHLFLFSV